MVEIHLFQFYNDQNVFSYDKLKKKHDFKNNFLNLL